MSAVAIPFDPTFTLGPRSNYAWPGSLDSSTDNVYPEQRAYSISSFEGASSPSPSTAARSLTGSPSMGSYTPESNSYKREIKREQNRARRDSRMNYRMRRAHSNNLSYDSPPPMAVGEGLDLCPYSSVPSQLPVLSESPSSMPSGHCVSSYTPPLPEHQPAAPMFPTPYQSHMPPTYPITVDYSGHLDSHSAFSRQSPPLVENSMLYPMPSVLPPSTSSSSTEGGHVRVVQSRPKPRCWEHGCNGRQFSTFSNLLRHQREKSGQASKASCPNCGAEFTRTTARNGHLLHDKCKQRNRS